MTETSPTHPIPQKPRGSRWSGLPAWPQIRLGEMTQMLLLAVAAALLTGLLALPFTMQGRLIADPIGEFGRITPVKDARQSA
ncbi:hypothetical protein [Tritonibacter mobilis]|uniref:hypothetical protein n=1 Tax=Tritonibacter mobilis TaxID=379347 RepID=UPI00338B3DA3|nr:hypothetical protein [Tritonibacter mobilis]